MPNKRSRSKGRGQGIQLPLPLAELNAYGLQAWHYWPLVMGEDRKIQGRLPAGDAWESWPYVEPNPPNAYAGLFFDIDNGAKWEFDSKAPVPNWEVRSESPPYTYHVAYTLEIPVGRYDDALLAPLTYYRRIYDGIADAIGADYRYNGLLIKNPLAPPSGGVAIWLRREPYTLGELREWLPADIPKPVFQTGVGRNVDLFEHCVKVAHQPGWARIIALEGHAGRWLEYVWRQNVAEYAEYPLPDGECRSIAKSCAKYSMRQYSDAVFRARQKGRIGLRWHDNAEYDYQSRIDAVATLVQIGYKQAEIAEMMGISIRTVRYDVAAYRRRPINPGDNAVHPQGLSRLVSGRQYHNKVNPPTAGDEINRCGAPTD